MRFLKKPYKEKSHSGKNCSPVSLRLKKSFDKICYENSEDETLIVKKIDIVFRHVKAHSNPMESIRYWLNNWCDKEARNVRMQYRSKFV